MDPDVYYRKLALEWWEIDERFEWQSSSHKGTCMSPLQHQVERIKSCSTLYYSSHSLLHFVDGNIESKPFAAYWCRFWKIRKRILLLYLKFSFLKHFESKMGRANRIASTPNRSPFFFLLTSMEDTAAGTFLNVIFQLLLSFNRISHNNSSFLRIRYIQKEIDRTERVNRVESGLADRFNKKEQKNVLFKFFKKVRSSLSPLLFCITPCVTSHSFYVPIFSLDWISNEIPRPCVCVSFL